MCDIDLSIITPAFNNANFTKLALEGLTKLPKNYEVIIVDNGSSDNTSEMMDDFLNKQDPERAKIVYIRSPKNTGFGRANNKGYKHSTGKNILFLNNDIRVDGDPETWPEEMIKLAQEGYILCAQGGLLDNKFDFIREGQGLPQTEYWYMSGWCVCASRETFDSLRLNHYVDLDDVQHEGHAWGPWDERFFLYFEDGDLSWRAAKQGIKIKEIKIPVHHFMRITGRKYNMFGWMKRSKKIFKEIWKDKYNK